MSDELKDMELLGIVSHDIKTPISAVRGFLDLVENTGELNEKQLHFLHRAILGIDRIESIVRTILDLTRIEGAVNYHVEDCNLGVLLQESVDMIGFLAKERGITLHLDVDDDLVPISGDPQWLRLTIDNLVNNAVKYNNDGGDVWVSARNQPGFVAVSVRDNGVGIPKKSQKRVFDRFYRESSNRRGGVDGAGLGLSIARMVVQKHGGYIWLESEPGKGSTFSFTLPRPDVDSEFLDIADADHVSSESQDIFQRSDTQVAHEEPDAVDDDMQEPSDSTDSDSVSDRV